MKLATWPARLTLPCTFPLEKSKSEQDGSRADLRNPQAQCADDEYSKLCSLKHTLLKPHSFS